MAQDEYIPDIISVYDDVTIPTEDNSVKKTPVSSGNDTEIKDSKKTSDKEAQPLGQEKVPAREKYNILKDKRWKVAIGIILILLATYLCISTFSYFTTAANDQSELENTTLTQLVNTTGGEIENIGGPAGALFSHRLFTYGLGVGVIPIFIYLILVGIWLLDIRKCNFWSLTFKTLLLAVTLSIVFGLIFYKANTVVPPGGYHGYYINNLLIRYFSWLGAVCVSLALIGCVVGVFFYDLVKLWRKYRDAAEKRRIRRRSIEEERMRILYATDKKIADSNATVDKSQNELQNAEEENGETADNNLKVEDDPLAVLVREENTITTEPEQESDTQFYDVEELDEPDNGVIVTDEPYDEPSVREETEKEDKPAVADSTENAKETPASSPFKSIDPSGSLYGALKLTEGGAEIKLSKSGKKADGETQQTEKTMDPDQESAEDTSNVSVEKSNGMEIHAEDGTTGEDSEKEKEDKDILTIQEGAKIEKGSGDNSHFDPTAELSMFTMPTVDLLINRPIKEDNVDISEIEDKKNQIIEALSKYGIGISKIEATVGPTVTMYEIVPAEGVKIATIKRLEEDIAMALAALSTRIIAPIPGKSAIGIEVPNRDPQTVSVRTIFESKDFQESHYELPLALGTTIDNRVFIADLAKMPHLLVAGATGKGKSVGMNVIINSLLYKKHPSELKLVLIDPKMVEFYPYRKLDKHYLAQVEDAENAIITDTSKVVETLNSLCVEMDDRYKLLQLAEVVKITDYNELIKKKKLSKAEGHKYLPYIIVVIDEYADLLMTAGKEIENPIARLAQKARAVGIHVIIATQRPSANIITGVIKGNFPARIAYKVTSNVDSNIILGNSGAFQLIGNGDMLVSQDGELTRVQCAFISTDEIKNVAGFISNQGGFGHPFFLPEPPQTGDKNASSAGGDIGDEDPLLEEVARSVIASGVASTSNIQRRYSIGYNRAGRIMDQLQAIGIVGPPQGGKPRDILVDSYGLEEILRNRR